GYLVLLVRFSGWMALALLVATIPAFIAEARFSGAAFRLRNWRSPDSRRLTYLEYVLGNDEHAKEVKLFGLGPLLLDRYKRLAGMYEATLYMSGLFDYLAIPANARQAIGPVAIVRDEEGIRFEGVGFRYPATAPGQDGGKWALRGVDVFVPKGQSLALVGENGAGKTTFIKLLANLYEPTEGRVLLDGRDLRTWDEGELRKRI